jgi:phosphomevalonate kinase
MYLGPPNLIATNASKNFVSKEFVDNATSLAIKVKEVLVKAHNSISKVEQYYAVIRRAFEIITSELGTSTTLEH